MLLRYFSAILLIVSGILMIGMGDKEFGVVVWLIGFLVTSFCDREFFKYMGLLFVSLGILAATHISTEITNQNFLAMGGLLTAAVVIPHLIISLVYGDRSTLQFQWRGKWSRTMIIYVPIAALLAYFILPWYLKDTGSYLNWTADLAPDQVTRLFIGTNALGIWDELFFCNTVLAILRKYFPFWQANLLQAFLFTSFLYELGFQGWYGPIIIFIFAWLQGKVFQRTENLTYIITIHLIVDAVLFLVLLHLHNPHILDIFLTA